MFFHNIYSVSEQTNTLLYLLWDLVFRKAGYRGIGSTRKSWTLPSFQEHRHESGSLILSDTVEHINSGDEEWARGVGVGTGHRSKKICLL